MSMEADTETALEASTGWRTNRHSWRDDLAADYEISQARLRTVIESSNVPQEYL